MKAKKMLVTAIMCAMISLGIGGTSSAATLTDNSLTNAIETQEFGYRNRNVRRSGHVHVRISSSSRSSGRYAPPPRRYEPPRRHAPTPRRSVGYRI